MDDDLSLHFFTPSARLVRRLVLWIAFKWVQTSGWLSDRSGPGNNISNDGFNPEIRSTELCQYLYGRFETLSSGSPCYGTGLQIQTSRILLKCGFVFYSVILHWGIMAVISLTAPPWLSQTIFNYFFNSLKVFASVTIFSLLFLHRI